MACKFHAAMTSFTYTSFFSRRRLALVAAGCLLAAVLPVQAERADRLKKMEVESDQPGKVDLINQLVVFNGNVVVSKGTMLIKAARIEVRESADGYQSAIAVGTPAQPASFRQKREGVNEFVEGEAERLEFDSKLDTIRFINKASVRRLRGTAVADEVTGALITYDGTAELFTVAGGSAAVTPANPTGRVRYVFTPKEGTPAAAEAASQAASSSPAQPASGARR
jgi:lipopolysaccharide export system protein LptA